MSIINKLRVRLASGVATYYLVIINNKIMYAKF